MQTKSGATVQTASVEYCTTANGIMTPRVGGNCPSDTNTKPPAIETALSTVDIDLTSDLPYSELSELISLYVVSPTGSEVFVKINGFIRTDANDLTLLTDIGDIEITGTEMSFTDTSVEKYFQRAGFTTVSGNDNRRRLKKGGGSNGKKNNNAGTHQPLVGGLKNSPTQSVTRRVTETDLLEYETVRIPSTAPVLTSQNGRK